MPILENKKMRPIRWVYDLLREKFPTRKKALTPPSVGMFDSPTACVQVNLEWSSHVIGALESLSQMDSWRGNDLTQFQALQEVEKLFNALAVESDCESDMPTLLRQNPTNSCLLEYSIDNGATWSLAFDYSLCIGETVQNTIENTINQGDIYTFINDSTEYIYLLRKEYRTTYNLTINNMYPSLVVPVGQQPSDFNEDALCYLCNDFVDSTSAMFVQAINEKNDNVGANQSSLFLAVIGVGLAIIGVMATGGIGLLWGSVAITGAAAAAAVGGFYYSIANVVSNLVLNGDELAYDYAYTAFQNATARRRVACCMYNNMIGLPSQAEFEASLSGCDFEPDSDEEKIRTALSDVIANGGLEVYLTFIDMYAGIAQGMEDGDIDPYECLCEEWCYLFDFTVDSYSTYFAPHVGQYVAEAQYATAWDSVDVRINAADRARTAGIRFTMPQETYIESIRWDWEYDKGTFAQNINWALREYIPPPVGTSTPVSDISITNPSAEALETTTFREFGIDAIMPANNSYRFQLYSSNDNVSPYTFDGVARITSVLICGRGRCPFGNPNYFPE
jgi:hypothetical protein